MFAIEQMHPHDSGLWFTNPLVQMQLLGTIYSISTVQFLNLGYYIARMIQHDYALQGRDDRYCDSIPQNGTNTMCLRVSYYAVDVNLWTWWSLEAGRRDIHYMNLIRTNPRSLQTPTGLFSDSCCTTPSHSLSTPWLGRWLLANLGGTTLQWFCPWGVVPQKQG